jgi:acetyl/propionyl-CoA carboxylase alpha subunit
MNRIKKIVIANRGEIAVRIIKTAHRLGIQTVAVYAEDDDQSLHVSQADEAILLEGNTLQETYLKQDKIIGIALEKGAQAIHPGYGFLSENASFAEKAEKSGLIFIGATADQIRLMGEKKQANQFVKKLGIPIIPSVSGSEEEISKALKDLEFPVLVKASGGGGGKGMKVVYEPEKLPAVMKRAGAVALKYFGNSELLVEKFLPKARHIEVQLFGDGKGNAVHFFERECSIQRHYQKLIEEAPAVSISEETKKNLYEAALKIAQAIHYRGAGTIEFLVDEKENFYFLEMNTRLQVEHPVTEFITDEDLVEWQIRIAEENLLTFSQNEIQKNGHAIELRICAEDPANGFSPTPGIVTEIHTPDSGRWDSYLTENTLIPPAYDSLAGKLIVSEKTREATISAMHNALSRLFISGVKTNQLLFQQILEHEDFTTNTIHTRWLENKMDEILPENEKEFNEEMIPELITGYLLHHFYRPQANYSPWNQTAIRRIHDTFEIQIADKKYSGNVLKRKNFLQINLAGKQFIVTNQKFNGSKISFSMNNKDIIIFISKKEDHTLAQLNSKQYQLRSNRILSEVQIKKARKEETELRTEKVVAGLFGKVIDILVKPGDLLQKGQDLVIIESMKSEITIKSPVAALVKSIGVSKGETVKDEKTLVEFEY